MMISYVLIFIIGILLGYLFKVVPLIKEIEDLKQKNNILHQVAMNYLFGKYDDLD